jgi:CBS domain-containing protein
MSVNPSCCTPDTKLQDVAQLMVQCDCGEIPVVEDRRTMKPVGVVTDRDITCRAVAEGRNPLDLAARDVMSKPVVTVSPDTSFDECAKTMEDHQIRRVPVVDEHGCLCGIVAQADVANYAPPKKAAEVVREVSQPTGSASR